jgi:hypothetical protein
VPPVPAVPRIDDVQRRARIALRHHLAPAHRAAGVAEATDGMTCLHATEPASVHLAAHARADVTRDDVDRALYVDRSIVKQLAMRRTVFVFPRALLPAVWASAAARVAAQQRSALGKDLERGGITGDADPGAWVDDAMARILALLRERGPMTTAELRTALPDLDARLTYAPGKAYGATVPVAPRVVIALAATGAIVRGENAGGWKVTRPRWTLTEQWLGEPPAAMEPAAAFAELVAAWLHTFGPGTVDDVVWWLGATKAIVRAALTAIGAAAVDTSSGPAWVLPDDLDALPEPEPWAALVPVLDPTVMGWKQRDFYLGPHRALLFDTNGNAGPTAWWDGRIVGGWVQRPDGEVVVVPLEDVGSAARRALVAAPSTSRPRASRRGSTATSSTRCTCRPGCASTRPARRPGAGRPRRSYRRGARRSGSAVSRAMASASATSRRRRGSSVNGPMIAFRRSSR